MSNKSDNNNEFFLNSQNEQEASTSVDGSKVGKYKKRRTNIIIFPDAPKNKKIANGGNLNKKDVENDLGI